MSDRPPWIVVPACTVILSCVLSEFKADAAEIPDDHTQTTTRHADLAGIPLPPAALARLGTPSWRHGSPIVSMTFAPDGRTLAVAAGDSICLWEVASGREALHLKHDWVQAIAISPNVKVLASGSGIGSIRLWDTASGKMLRQFGSVESGKIHALTFAPDSSLLVSGNQDKTVRVWDVSTGQAVGQVFNHDGPVYALAISRQGTRLAAGSRGVRVWDVTSKKQLHQFGDKTVTFIAFSANGESLVVAGPGQRAGYWELGSGKEVRQFQPIPRSDRLSQAIACNGRVLAQLQEDRTIRLWELASGKELWKCADVESDLLAISSDGMFLASAGPNHAARLWNTVTGKELSPSDGHQAAILALGFAPKGARLFSAAVDGTRCVWEMGKVKPQQQARQSLKSHRFIVLSPGREMVAAAMENSPLQLSSFVRGNELPSLPGMPPEPPTCAVFSADSKVLAVGYQSLPVHVWELSRPGKPRLYPGADHGVLGLAFSPDGKTLAAIEGGGQIHGWDIVSAKHVRVGDSARAGAPVVFSPNGKLLATGGEDGIINLWDVGGSRAFRQLHGHPDTVHALAFSPDGRVLASGGGDTAVRLWEVCSGQEIQRWSGHTGPVTALAFSQDGRALASGSTDTTLLVWDATGQRSEAQSHPIQLGPQALETLWTRLAGGDGPQAYDAVWKLVAASKESVPFLFEQLRIFFEADPKRIEALIADLDHDSYAVRERATRELEKLAKWAKPALERTAANPPSLEVQRRIEDILRKLKSGVTWAQERLRVFRAVDILEKIGSTEARQMLDRLAQRFPDDDIRQEAKASLDRLARQEAPAP
jgi:WD40 repeat protein